MAVDRLILTLTSGLFVVVLGALIKYKGMSKLIAGYDPDEVADEQGLNNFIGTNAILVGVLTMVVGIVDYLGVFENIVWIAFGVIVVIFAGRMIFGSRRYTY
ncbi:DUF3784 domain-containing protein [Haladaptatus cibarius]|uniref:DUF3784 domain-containing protein n=1 Tax=Haladaptatus cibarius TaxID=453847 RepID=UPI00067943D8|nr:DUF3784 domain-containing protein [Haladaptatus cibarius]